ncbi:MAG: hypothetical protein ACM33V_11785 [Chloroflexota bacterium]
MNTYKTQYADLHFERAGLFKALREKYDPKDVLYPGCSVHVTPSLYFPHVVYVDQSEAAKQFFADEKSLLEFVNRNKQYKPSAHIRFLLGDYSGSLPLREGNFDLLLSLFAGGIAKACAKYLRPGGLLLTNNHQGDAHQAASDPGLRLKATIQFKRGSYSIREEDPGKVTIPAQKPDNRYLRQVSRGVEYVEGEIYYVFERFQPRKVAG